MRLPADQASSNTRFHRRSPQLMLLGLVVLGLGLLWPTTPIVAAVALVCLGATVATTERLRHSPARVSLLLVHVALYGSLYSLFVGVSLDLAAKSGHDGLNALAFIDLAASLGPLAAAGRLVVGVLRDADPV